VTSIRVTRSSPGLAFDEGVVTDDGDFENVDGLDVEGY